MCIAEYGDVDNAADYPSWPAAHGTFSEVEARNTWLKAIRYNASHGKKHTTLKGSIEVARRLKWLGRDWKGITDETI